MEKSPVKYIDATSAEISEDRVLKRNGYAHLDDDSPLGFSAIKESHSDQAASQYAISKSRELLQNPYAHEVEGAEIGFSALSGDIHIDLPAKKSNYNYDELEEVAHKIQRDIWENKNKIWPMSIPSDPVDMLDPILALRLVGYESSSHDTLGEFLSEGRMVEVAGTFDSETKTVTLSQRFPIPVKNFTAAHELGHAVLHTESGLHRDRPLDGTNASKNSIEREADKFAAFFLMPENLVKTRFRKQFLIDNFLLDESTSFALGYEDYVLAHKELKTLRQLSRKLARAEYYNGKYIISLAQQFKVSVDAMAIRLLELGLITG